MNLAQLSFADLHAMTAYAKQKENYYRSIKYIDFTFAEKHDHWKKLLETFEQELQNRFININF